MLELLFYIVVCALLVLTDLVPAFREKDKKAAVFSTTLFALGLILLSMRALNVDFPSTTEPLIQLIKSITGTGS